MKAKPQAFGPLVRFLSTRERDEPDGDDPPAGRGSVVCFSQQHEILQDYPDGNNQSPAWPELRNKCGRNMVRRCGDDDGIVGRVLLPALIAIADPGCYVRMGPAA
jgi:hypothetical protein